APVVVLAATTAEQLFGGRDPVGETATISGVSMQVVGTLASAGSSATANEDDQAVVPITTAADRLFGGASRSSVQSIYLEAASADVLSAAYQEAQNELLALHHIADPASADFNLASQQAILSAATSVDRTLTILLGGIAGISLLVGGIGVMN